ncbi:MAG: hypothetical protein JWP07_898 [Pseudonocardiales bacterium]|jgi:hypothetical protein|nr:hypothetical protein [Pseudonocardiales bacterium]
MPRSVVIVAGGHAYDSAAFARMWARVAPERHTIFPRESLAAALDTALAQQSVLVLYDLSGIDVTRGQPVVVHQPPSDVLRGFAALNAAATPILAMHHALASWPTWPSYAELLGGRFHYQAGTLRGEQWPASGFRLDVRQGIAIETTAHPICTGLARGFDLVDEPYLCPIFANEVTVLMTTDAPREDTFYVPVDSSVAGHPNERRGWRHPPTPPAAVWCRDDGRLRLVYVQPGHNASTFDDPNYRLLLSNSLVWLSECGD